MLYDTQTRSMLVTPQRYPHPGSQAYPSPAGALDADGSITLFSGPEQLPDVADGSWVQTVASRGWFVLLRFSGSSSGAEAFRRVLGPRRLQ